MGAGDVIGRRRGFGVGMNRPEGVEPGVQFQPPLVGLRNDQGQGIIKRIGGRPMRPVRYSDHGSMGEA